MRIRSGIHQAARGSLSSNLHFPVLHSAATSLLALVLSIQKTLSLT